MKEKVTWKVITVAIQSYGVLPLEVFIHRYVTDKTVSMVSSSQLRRSNAMYVEGNRHFGDY